jgi:signal transduction histidine kinase/CheY-like chemotaxis protein
MVNKLTSATTIKEPVLRILLIEDNPGDIIIIRELLKLSGTRFKLTVAHSVTESINLLRSGNYDIILLDLGLPDSSGLETLREFVFLETGTPVVVMTGLDDEDMALASLRYGAQDYLVKNRFGSENILKSIKYSIERKKLENLQKRNSHQLSILSETTAALYGGDDIPSIYNLICKSIRRLIANSIVVSIEFIDPYSFHLSNTEQLEPWKDEIRNLTGISIGETVFRRSGQRMEILEMFKDGRLHFLKEGIFEVLGDSISLENASRIESSTGIRNMYLIGFLRNDIYYGGILIFSQNPVQTDDISIIENLCSQASLGIYRRVIQKNLIASESRYQKLAGELEEKVRERTSELENANKQLRQSEAQLMELNATKDKFFNIVAHDLKNPFTSLLGATELLFNNIENMDRTKIRKLAQILNDSAKSGYSILLNLLDWSRSQTGTIRINLQKLNIGKVIDENIADVHLNSIDKEISISAEIPEDIQVIADRNMINTVVRNLISNALKFTHRGGKVVISCRLEGNEVYVSVKDNGIGISKENITKLFRIDSKFSKPGTDKETGTGLGLKLSREFVEKLGGRIWVESTENVGSEFIFTIPLQGNKI